ncbi:hypothetical protein ACFL0H_15600 [Thermodesulfobacteriota bacterium]
MNNDRCQRSIAGGKNIASIDIGSHTARLLVAKRIDTPELFEPLARDRAYIRLAEGFGVQGIGSISTEAIERTLKVLEKFLLTLKEFGAEDIRAVTTGVVRRADNRNYFLSLIHEKTGIDVTGITGEEEARLTYKGVLRAINIDDGTSVIFDLGGGTTEFISRQKDGIKAISVPLGAVLLTQRFLDSDPPRDDKIEALSGYTDDILEKALPRRKYDGKIAILAGSGGTVTTLAAMLKNIDIKGITPDKLNGLILERRQIEDLFDHMKSVSISERMRLPGLDRGRAGVILAGTMAVIRILYFFNCVRMTVSHSDILEGILISYLQGEQDE